MAILNNFSHPIIAEDLRDPYQSFRNHIARGSRGGVDLSYPYGTPVYAPCGGRFSFSDNTGSGGVIGSLICAEGTIELMHLSKGVRRGPVLEGDLIAYSGASGFGKWLYYDPHLHVDIETDKGRRNLWDYFTPTAPAAVDLDLLVTIPKDEDDMALRPIYAKGSVAPNIYAFYQNAEFAGGGSGATYFARRDVSPGEWAIVEKTMPNDTQKELIIIDQDEFDTIGRVYGSA